MPKSQEVLLAARVMDPTPAGPLTLMASADGLSAISFGRLVNLPSEDPAAYRHLDMAERQLNEYFSGQRKTFDLTLDWSGMTAYQEQVLRACYAIPYGEVRTYGDLARQTGRPGAARAVGAFMASNPFPIVIPCHRVLGSDGSLHGYGGGLDVKAWLLKLEGVTFVG